MRALLLLGLVACSPDIASESYLCGQEEACPKGQVCDGPTNACVLPSTSAAFACDPMVVHDDDTLATANAITNLQCVSSLNSSEGCLALGDGHNWYSFTAPTGCAAVEVVLRVSFPYAFEPVGLSLFDASGTQIATDGACTGNQVSITGDDVRCLTQTITSGQTYAISVEPAGGMDCDGKCAFNRYTLNFQLATP